MGCQKQEAVKEVVEKENPKTEEEFTCHDTECLSTLDWSRFENQESLDRFMASLTPELYELALTIQGGMTPDEPESYDQKEDFGPQEPVVFTFNPTKVYTVGIDLEPGKYNLMSEDDYTSYAYDVNDEAALEIAADPVKIMSNYTLDWIPFYYEGTFIDLEEGQQLKFSTNAKIGNMKREFLRFDKTFTEEGVFFMDNSNEIFIVGEDIAEGKYRVSTHPYVNNYSSLYFLDENLEVIKTESGNRDANRLIYLATGDRIKVDSSLVLMKYN